jgi:hypothetical protein
MKKSNVIIGNRTRDVPVCSAVPQPTAPPAACPQYIVHTSINTVKHNNLLHKVLRRYISTSIVPSSGLSKEQIQCIKIYNAIWDHKRLSVWICSFESPNDDSIEEETLRLKKTLCTKLLCLTGFILCMN